MKVKIDKYGNLWFMRKCGWVRVNCPNAQSQTPGLYPCGDHCALFSEPEYFKADEICPYPNVELPICSKLLSISADDFIDERETFVSNNITSIINHIKDRSDFNKFIAKINAFSLDEDGNLIDYAIPIRFILIQKNFNKK